MFRVKICGITTVEDARAVAAAGADAVGLNFAAGSVRCIDLDQARRIVDALDARIAKVGVFVNAPYDQIARAVELLELDLVQLHGDEPPEFAASINRCAVIRAFRVGRGGPGEIFDYLDVCRVHSRLPERILLDAWHPALRGGSGRRADWSLAARLAAATHVPDLVLAGGLSDSNVAQAILAVSPAAVDVASGVEREPGRKDADRTARFIAQALAAFDKAASRI